MTRALRILRGARTYAVRFGIALAIFFVVGEALARALNVVDPLNGYSRIIYTRTPSPDLPYVLRPNDRGSDCVTAPVLSRAHGLAMTGTTPKAGPARPSTLDGEGPGRRRPRCDEP